MSIHQIDAPLHVLEFTEYQGQYTGRKYAQGHIDGVPVAITPVPGFDGYAASYYGPLPGESYTVGATYEEAEAIIRAAVFFHDPRVCFTIAAGGTAGRQEIQENVR